jgi:hypothetical protein
VLITEVIGRKHLNNFGKFLTQTANEQAPGVWPRVRRYLVFAAG